MIGKRFLSMGHFQIFFNDFEIFYGHFLILYTDSDGPFSK